MSELPKVPKVFLSKHWQPCYESWCLHIFRSGCESKKTIKTYSGTIKQFFTGLNCESDKKSRSPESVKQQEVENFLNLPGRDNRPPSPYTYNNRLAILSSFYSYAARYDIASGTGTRKLFHATSPTHGLSARSTKPADRTLTQEEVTRFVSVIPRDTVAGLRDRAMVLFYLWTGRRCAEIVRLRWRDLECRGGQWYYSFRGKGHRDTDDKDWLHPDAKEALDEYLEVSGRIDTIQADDALFTAIKWRSQPLPMNPGSINDIFKPYWEAAGLKGSCHFFRHTHAYNFYLATGKDIVKVSHRLRHRSLNQTRDYLEAAEKTDMNDMAALAARFGKL